MGFKPEAKNEKKIKLLSYKVVLDSTRQLIQYQPAHFIVEISADLTDADVEHSIEECHRRVREGLEQEFTKELKARGLD